MPITEEKEVKRRKYRIVVNIRYRLDKVPVTRKDDYLVTCGEDVSPAMAWRHEHARIMREEIPNGATDVNIFIRTDLCK